MKKPSSLEGARLRAMRLARDWTQADLASRCVPPMSAKNVHDLETKDRMTAKRARQLAAAFGVPETEFFKGGIEPSELTVYVPMVELEDGGRMTMLARGQRPTSDQAIRTEYPHDNLIAVRVVDGSIDKEVPKGGVAIFDTTEKTLIHGKFYLIMVGERGRVRCYRQASEFYPGAYFEAASTSENHPIIQFSPLIVVIGKLVRSQREH